VIAVLSYCPRWLDQQGAKEEANRYGMHPWEMGMKNYIHDFYQRHTKQKQSVTNIQR